MARILNHPRVYSFLHVPVQSGSDLVLEAMKREYTRHDFEHVVDFLRARQVLCERVLQVTFRLFAIRSGVSGKSSMYSASSSAYWSFSCEKQAVFLHVSVCVSLCFVAGMLLTSLALSCSVYLFPYLSRVPEVTIATDLICGFPTETPEVNTGDN